MNLDKLKFIDLTYGINSNIPQWDLDCGFRATTIVDYQENQTPTKFKIQHLQMVSGIGTHLDAPSHCIAGGLNIADIPIESLIRPCIVINVENKSHENYQVSVSDIEEFEAQFGKIAENDLVIIHTGWGMHWNSLKYRNNLQFPSVSTEAANLLVLRKISGLAIDTLSPDTAISGFPVHQILLQSNIYIIENVANSHLLPPVGVNILALPIKLEQATEAPLRLVGIIS